MEFMTRKQFVNEYFNHNVTKVSLSSYDDVVYYGPGKHFITGNDGNDTIGGGMGRDVILGNVGNDSLYGGNNGDWLGGGVGDDFLYGERGNDILSGGKGNDTLDGGDHDDVLNGGIGNDTILDSQGFDLLLGGANNDRFVFVVTTGVSVAEHDIIGDFAEYDQFVTITDGVEKVWKWWELATKVVHEGQGDEGDTIQLSDGHLVTFKGVDLPDAYQPPETLV